MKINSTKNECVEPEVGLYVLDWQQGWLETERLEDCERKQAVERHLTQCAACMEGVVLMDELKTVLRQHPDLLDEPERYIPQERPQIAFIPRWRAVAALAAGLVLGATLALNWRAGGLEPQSSLLHSPAMRQAASDKLVSARSAYTSGRYLEVIDQLEASAQKGDLSAEGSYYLGLSYAGLGRREAACEHLTQAVHRSGGALQEDARWALVQSLVAAGRVEPALQHLADLASRARYAAQAAALSASLQQGTAVSRPQ